MLALELHEILLCAEMGIKESFEGMIEYDVYFPFRRCEMVQQVKVRK